MKVHDSARKHGIEPDDAVYAAEHAVFVDELDENDPARQLRLGFDAAGRLLEIEYLDPVLRRAAHEQGRPSGWTEKEVRRLRLIVQCLMAAQIVDDVLNMPLLRLRPDSTDEADTTTALSPGLRLTIAFKAHSKPITAVLDTAP